MEQWVLIEDFPDYEVSSAGRVRNAATGRVLGLHNNGGGTLQVVIRRDKKNHARAVHKLVAIAFLDAPPGDYVPVHIDGDWLNNSAENLVWKERWFAQARTRQDKRTRPRDPRRILEVRTGRVWENALECAKELGGLENLLILTAQNRHGSTYLKSSWKFIDY